jgi:hypothetical protein
MHAVPDDPWPAVQDVGAAVDRVSIDAATQASHLQAGSSYQGAIISTAF